MGIKGVLAKHFAKYVAKKNLQWINNPIESQENTLTHLLKKASNTSFGLDHGFKDIHNHQQFIKSVSFHDYEGLRPYLDRVVEGEKDVLWPGKPLYFSKTSGTTSGVKYIPISKESISTHINSARDALLSYARCSNNYRFFDGKMIFLSGSPEMSEKNGVHIGRLSGIVNHHIPQYLRKNQLPSYSTNTIDDWEDKLDVIISETLNADMRLISGIPPWVQMYFDRIQEKTGKSIKEVFPNFEVFVHGGVNFEPYRDKLLSSIGGGIDSVETYPASEGFIAYQDDYRRNDLLLLLNNDIYYEFIPVDEYFTETPTRLSLENVKVGVNYAIILNTSAGLWGYSIGDTVKFTSTEPYRLLVTGRIKHFISAFGEHVIGEEVEQALSKTCQHYPEVSITEFTVAPSINPEKGSSCHEWFIEFNSSPSNMNAFQSDLNSELAKLNTYYDDLISGNILQKLKVIPLVDNTFIDYMKSIGKLGGQNKVPRLSNDRKIADSLGKFVVAY